MEAQRKARFADVLGVLGRPFRRKAIVLSHARPANDAVARPTFEIPEVPFVSYEPFRDYRPGTAGDPSLRW